MELQKDEKIIFEKKYLSTGPLTFSDSDTFPLQWGWSKGDTIYLTNKRIYDEIPLMQSPMLDLPIKDIKSGSLRKVIFRQFLVVDSLVPLKRAMPNPFGNNIPAANALLESTVAKPTYRVWINLGADSQMWSDKLNELLNKK